MSDSTPNLVTTESLSAPLDGDGQEVLEQGAVDVQPAPVVPVVADVDQAAHSSKLARMRAILAAQPTRRIRIRKEDGPQTVIINGARTNIPAGIHVDVAEQIAQVLEDAGRI